MADKRRLDPKHHVFRHIKKSWMAGDFIDPAAFRLSVNEGVFEDGLSVNWVEYFQKDDPAEAVAALRVLWLKKDPPRKMGGESKLALLKVEDVVTAAAKYVPVHVMHDEQPGDDSHSLVTGYEAFNDQVAEAIAEAVMSAISAKPVN